MLARRSLVTLQRVSLMRANRVRAFAAASTDKRRPVARNAQHVLAADRLTPHLDEPAQSDAATACEHESTESDTRGERGSSSSSGGGGGGVVERGGAPGRVTARIMAAGSVCSGCGSELQSRAPHEPGYVPPAAAAADARGTVLDEHGAESPTERQAARGARAGGAWRASAADDEAIVREQLERELGATAAAALLADYEPDADGHVPAQPQRERRRAASKARICQRCFALRHYGRLTPVRVPLKADVVNELLLPLRSQQVFVLQLVDLFDVAGTLVEDFHRYLGPTNRVLLVANKLDLLPRNTKPERVTGWLRRYVRERHPELSRRLAGVRLVSARTGEGVRETLRYVDKLNTEKRDIFVVGCTNVGKSTFVNHVVGDKSSSNITVSRVHGTTLANIYVPYPRQTGVSLVDTPGLVSDGTLAANAGVEPRRRVRATTVRVRRGKSVMFGGLARIDYVSGGADAVYLTLFAAAELTMHVTATTRADELRQQHCGRPLLQPPFLDDLPEDERARQVAERFAFRSEPVELQGESWRDACTDIVLPGVGWVAVVVDGHVRLDVHTIHTTHATLREPLMPYEMRTKTTMYKQK